ncbi:MAG TPA: rod shape-determining protein RodA [Alphaproteobacteria bacterium]|nr:rod shape-determining protein RodA [Alphaproteobacteria bacterium]
MAMRAAEPKLLDKLQDLNWLVVGLVTVIAAIGFAMLFSVAQGSFQPWAAPQMARFGIGFVIMIAIALVNIRFWMSLAYPAYAIGLLGLLAVEVFGKVGKGAERWLEIGPVQVQPSEFMKLALILALARFLHTLSVDNVSSIRNLVVALLMIAAPVGLVLLQPNLGTATILAAVGVGMLFVAGLSWKIIIPAACLAVAAVPVGWQFLHDYQKERVYTFLEPNRDPLGAGYNILQSKIALGSGGVFGKGFLNGTQSRLNFLPEKQTDFIFTVLGEEFGLMGLVFLMLLYCAVLASGAVIALQSRSHFGRMVATGVCLNLFLYILINCSMSMGLIPVVGIPLPLVSYGGTALIAVMAGMGLLLSAQVHRGVEISRLAAEPW